jgi:hypothetical protein
MSEKAEAIIKQHEAIGNNITIDGVKTFYIDAGTGPKTLPISSAIVHASVIPVTKVRSKHFLQEEEFVVIAAKVKELLG